MMDATSTVHRGAGRPTAEQAEARHEELLDAALEEFLEHGFELTTIEMIAARINMTKRTVYARHADKAALFRGAVQRAIERQVVPRGVLEGFDKGDLTVRVPADNAELVGVRDVVGAEGLERVFEVLRAPHTEEPTNWSRRYKANLEKLASGDVNKVAEVVRDLWRRDRERGLSAGEKRMLAKARQIDHGPQRSAYEALNLLTAPGNLAGRRLALASRQRRARQHRIFGRHPPASLAA